MSGGRNVKKDATAWSPALLVVPVHLVRVHFGARRHAKKPSRLLFLVRLCGGEDFSSPQMCVGQALVLLNSTVVDVS